MKKRLSAAIMALVMTFAAAGMPVYASGTTVTDEDTANVPISAFVSSSYTVVLPSVTQTLADEDNDGIYTGAIAYDVYGKINSDKALVVMAGDGTGLSYAQDLINLGAYKTSVVVSREFHMTGASGGRTVTGNVTQIALRFLARGVTTQSPLDRNIPAEASDIPPFGVEMEISIPYTDTFTGNMPFTFGLIDK